MNLFEKLVDILIAVIILFMFPMMYFGQRQDTITQQVVSAETSDFVNLVRTQGFLTQNMYDTFLSRLDATNVVYDIQLEHKEIALEPEYRFKTASEVIDDQNAAWKGSNVYTYVPVTTAIPTVTDPTNNDGLNMNTETNASVLAGAVNGGSDPGHIHTDDCYAGHRHNASCASRICDCGGASGTIVFKVIQLYRGYAFRYSCKDCNKTIYGIDCDDENDSSGSMYIMSGINSYYLRAYDQDSEGLEAYGYIDIINIYDRFKYNYRNNLLSAELTSREFIDLYNYIFTQNYYYNNNPKVWGEDRPYNSFGSDLNNFVTRTCNQIEDTTPICNQIVTSITPTHPIQTLYINDSLLSTATIHYKDGSSKVAVCDANFVPNIIVNNKTVTLSYAGFTSTISVTVIPKTKTCLHGHTYNLANDGSDPGCIYCKSWLSSLIVASPSTGELIIYKGTTLEANGVVLLATYLNGSTELLYSGYVNNLDTNYVGTQTVTISYKGKYVTLKVTSKRKLVRCGKCGKYYELYPDGSNPGCPFCTALIPVFTGNVLKYYAKTYSDEILKKLYKGAGTYYFKAEDYFSIDLSNRSKTLGTRVFGMIIPGIPQTSIHVEYGGVIRDETQVSSNLKGAGN